MVADGNVPWSMGFGSDAATGWTGSDFIQDLLLTQQGPQYVMDIINGKPVKGMDDIRSVLKAHPKQVALLIKRDDETLFVPVPLG